MGTDWSRSVRGAGPVLLVALIVQALVGWVGARAYLTDRNTLVANGRWSSTKTELERGLLGAWGFVQERQSLAGGRLNLGAWHGFQEVLWNREVEDLRSLEFDFELTRLGWIGAVLDRRDGEGSFHVMRFGGAVHHGNALLEVDEDGRFLEQRPLKLKKVPNRVVMRARIELGPNRLTVFINGQRLGSFDYDGGDRQRFGFRGGLEPVFVDNVEARFGDGGLLREEFDAPPGAWRLTAVVIAVVALVNLALFLALAAKLEVSGRHLGFYFLMINLTLLVVGVLAYLLVAERSGWYPGLSRSLAQREHYLRKGESERVREQVAGRFAALAGEERYRILFVGSSQTWGAGARRDGEEWVARLERLLNEGPEPRFSCINGGISASRASDLVPLLEEWLPAGEPDMVVVNLASNDRTSPPGEFDASIRRMVELVLEAGARPVLLKEPRIFVDRHLAREHQTLNAVAADYGIPALEVQTSLQRASQTGFLWWDKVHLTSYGQELLAHRLHDELLPLINHQG